jgi:hypothetical protein
MESKVIVNPLHIPEVALPRSQLNWAACAHVQQTRIQLQDTLKLWPPY